MVKDTTDHDKTLIYQNVLFTGLQYNTLYNIRVVAVYSDGIVEIPGLPSPTVNIKTSCKGSFSLSFEFNGVDLYICILYSVPSLYTHTHKL